LFVTVHKRQRLKSFINQTTSIRLELPATLEKSFVSNFKITCYFFKLRVRMFSAVWWPLDRLQASASLYSFWFEMKRLAMPI